MVTFAQSCGCCRAIQVLQVKRKFILKIWHPNGQRCTVWLRNPHLRWSIFLTPPPPHTHTHCIQYRVNSPVIVRFYCLLLFMKQTAPWMQNVLRLARNITWTWTCNASVMRISHAHLHACMHGPDLTWSVTFFMFPESVFNHPTA